MANIKSAKKRIKTNLKARLRNRMAKSKIKTAIRAFREAVSAGETVTAQEKFVQVKKLLDTASGKGILHANNVARKKSRLSSLLKKTQSET